MVRTFKSAHIGLGDEKLSFFENGQFIVWKTILKQFCKKTFFKNTKSFLEAKTKFFWKNKVSAKLSVCPFYGFYFPHNIFNRLASFNPPPHGISLINLIPLHHVMYQHFKNFVVLFRGGLNFFDNFSKCCQQIKKH